MKKFVAGLLIGCLAMYIGYIGNGKGISAAEADEAQTSIGAYSPEQKEAMKLAWYEYHHDTLSKALAGECSE